MANTIQIKRRTADATAPTTGNTEAGELAYNESAAAGGQILYINESDTSIVKVGGPGLWDGANTVVVSKGVTRTPEAQALGLEELLGRGSSGNIAPITLGTGLTMTGTVLAASGAATVDLLDIKQSVHVATTAAGTLASSFENGDTIDGVVLVTGDRILIKDQASGSENGIYTVEATGAPTRATDADADAEVTANMFCWVEEGTTNADTGWVLTTNDPITVDTTALVFAQFSGVGQIVAGDGLAKTGPNTLDVDLSANSGLQFNAGQLEVNEGTSLVLSGGVLNAIQDIRTSASPDFTGLSISGLTATRVLFAGASGVISDDAGMTYVSGTDTLTVGVVDGATIDGGSF